MAKYDWQDGKGRVHSRPKRTGKQLEQAKDSKRLADPGYFTQPMTLGQTLTEAKRAEDLRYGGVQGQLDLQSQQIPSWFQDYQNTIRSPQQVQAQYQPVIAQQQQTAQQSGQTLGLQGPAGEQDQLAAKAREALAQLGTTVLQGQQQADTTYFQGRQGVAQAAQLGALTQNRQALTDLSRERGAFRDQYVTDARNAERTYGLQERSQTNEDSVFRLDVAKAKAAVQTDRQKIRLDAREKQRARKDKAQTVNQYGYSNEQWSRFSPSHRRRIINEGKSSSGGSESKAYTPAQQHTATVDLRKAVGLVQGKLNGKKTAPDTFWNQAYSALVGEKGMDPALARAAIQLVKGGKVGAKTRATLERDYGITKFPRGSKRKKPPAYTVPSRPGTAPSGTGDGKGNDSRRPTAYNPDTDTGGAEWRADYERWRKKRWTKMSQGPSRRQIS